MYAGVRGRCAHCIYAEGVRGVYAGIRDRGDKVYADMLFLTRWYPHGIRGHAFLTLCCLKNNFSFGKSSFLTCLVFSIHSKCKITIGGDSSGDVFSFAS